MGLSSFMGFRVRMFVSWKCGANRVVNSSCLMVRRPLKTAKGRTFALLLGSSDLRIWEWTPSVSTMIELVILMLFWNVRVVVVAPLCALVSALTSSCSQLILRSSRRSFSSLDLLARNDWERSSGRFVDSSEDNLPVPE